ncbi:MAG: hypothetical protein IJI25_05105 [Eubacterium sp.]|nr:hypothetical protein [Eubacterium sp.]
MNITIIGPGAMGLLFGGKLAATANVSLIGRNAPDGYASLCVDIKNRRKTEVDFITGAVVKAAREQNLSVPVQETILRLIHAMEGSQYET